MSTTEALIWAFIWFVIFYFVLLMILEILARIRDYLSPLKMREVDAILRRDKTTCVLSVDKERCKNDSQHLRHIGGIFTPRLKQWVVVCPKHLYVPISRKEAKEIISKL